MKEITVAELKKKIDNGDQLTVLDVREIHETYISNPDIEKTIIPLDDLPDKLDELDKDGSIVCICRSGNRSGKACKLLDKNGFKSIYNVIGGVNEWAKKIDTSLPVY